MLNKCIFSAGDKPHVCNVCDKRFALACNLRAHLKTHQGSGNELSNAIEGTKLTSTTTNSASSTSTTAIMNENSNNSSHSSKRACSSPGSSSSSRSSSPLGHSHHSQLTKSGGQLEIVGSSPDSIPPMVMSRPCRPVITNNGHHENKNLEQFLHLMTASLLAMKSQQQ